MPEIDVLEERIDNFRDNIEAVDNRVERLEVRVNKMDGAVVDLENYRARTEETMKYFEEKIDNIELTLKEIVKELRELGNKLIAYKTERGLGGVSKSFLDRLLDNNNRQLLYLVTFLGAGLLLALGMKVNDIFNILN